MVMLKAAPATQSQDNSNANVVTTLAANHAIAAVPSSTNCHGNKAPTPSQMSANNVNVSTMPTLVCMTRNWIETSGPLPLRESTREEEDVSTAGITRKDSTASDAKTVIIDQADCLIIERMPVVLATAIRMVPSVTCASGTIRAQPMDSSQVTACASLDSVDVAVSDVPEATGTIPLASRVLVIRLDQSTMIPARKLIVNARLTWREYTVTGANRVQSISLPETLRDVSHASASE